MKYSFLILCLFIILFSCKKEIPQSPHLPQSIMGKIKLQLKDSVSTADMLQLDFSHSFISNTDKSDFSIIRIPLLNKKINYQIKIVYDFSKTNTAGNSIGFTKIKIIRNRHQSRTKA